ncbi:MAG: hypothetical protein ACRC06_00370 [Waterburya sp.]
MLKGHSQSFLLRYMTKSTQSHLKSDRDRTNFVFLYINGLN